MFLGAKHTYTPLESNKGAREANYMVCTIWGVCDGFPEASPLGERLHTWETKHKLLLIVLRGLGGERLNHNTSKTGILRLAGYSINIAG